jgi:predicted enzyme related to lactoylglutathione lyase
MASVTKVGMVILMEQNLEDAVTFYKKLGLNLKFHLKNQWAEFSLGDMKVGLCPSSDTQDNKVTGIVFEVDDLRSLYNELKGQGFPFVNEPIEKIHGIMVSFKDPSGNIVDLYQPTPEKIRELVKKTVKEGIDEGCCGSSQKCCKAEA